MKKAIFALFVVLLSASCNNAQLRKSVSDDGKTMKIEVKVNSDKQKINYQQSFDVSNMSDEQKKELIHHIFDSLGVPDKR